MAVLSTLLFGSVAARLAGWFGVDYVDSWTAGDRRRTGGDVRDDRGGALRTAAAR